MLFSTLTRSLLMAGMAVVSAHDTGSPSSLKEVPIAANSLPELLSLQSIPANWISSDETTLEEGRIILTPKKQSKGSLWLKSSVKLNKEFTIEWTVRSVNYEGTSTGGMSLWFISSDKMKDTSLYNGPSKFNGLQILVDNNGPLGQSIRGQLSDGSVVFKKEGIYDKSFGSCLMGYQGTSVPVTIRLSYSENLGRTSSNMLKLQVDNRVCFQTNKINFPRDAASNNGLYNVGVSADNGNTVESFEVLKMNYYDTVTEEALIPNVKAMGQPRMIAKIIDQSTGEVKTVEKEVLDEQNDRTSNYELFQKIDKIEGKILANDIKHLQDKLEKITNNQMLMVEQMNRLLEKLNSGESTNGEKQSIMDEESYKQFFSVNEKLEKLFQEREKVREVNQKEQSLQSNSVSSDEILKKLAVWLLPFAVLIVVLAYYTFQIRNELTKTKLL
ncbi:similar to Saccharomyces cerevisiae YFL048C EMP47 Integral membrane component of endoplasmic reticulum-derived COPII-coated vesicles, which function in ER to Golgi transport [Maudiozyma barnettii]|uniref:Similar to Saccharomyces cerevisiae YFL048C EMP47 Integral membrane component of endoplasmic reticulum-derived COPII-coated vesicles, which function in ER to Golgi transport n=1 Tax=Maudiozyma barnettii TaxID=61262 RepID=A0A8H2ZEQ3_9SACH|nr:Emp47p [Kazachstania barnettii]CAB4252491.1 similar to Saccharomyces cerevisiae YFL048C EMP47 Integral membrane component of endoplasmic reticulum-derived COPII-coated vesicles, which function in ER to Golgi transport [Kazachstania barnettii]CAD1779225.1 similar to Saccharomyces cerevisiae YFL048C EMP47 Integral membrane component of endoplasmic reticulum-derived COPII-coated vesicles, which function in ER to Golgi transport [Kazachstania barnettii]